MSARNSMLAAWDLAVATWRTARAYNGADYEGVGAAGWWSAADTTARYWRSYLPATLVSPAATAHGA
jgi:hypothetical protein